MYKIKTNKAASKRFKVTGSGKVKFTTANRRHLLTGKAQKLKRQARNAGYMQAGDARKAKQLLGLMS
ncbi:MAG: 50S ribosomal protein L35 [Gammaproteobacteria bacterium]|nr:50S ribosomal protein L35 [Gammaproteobacteria bacterium]